MKSSYLLNDPYSNSCILLVIFQTTLTEVQFGPMKLIKDPLQVLWKTGKHLMTDFWNEYLFIKVVPWTTHMNCLCLYQLGALSRAVELSYCYCLSGSIFSMLLFAQCHQLLFAVCRTNLKFLNHPTPCWENEIKKISTAFNRKGKKS